MNLARKLEKAATVLLWSLICSILLAVTLGVLGLIAMVIGGLL
jgi:hypothetical protein